MSTGHYCTWSDTKVGWSGARLSIQIAVERDSMTVGQREERGIGGEP